MMTFLFNEMSVIESMIKMNFVDDNNIFITIRDLARYNYFVHQMDNATNYQSILKYIQKNGKNINEEDVYQIIDRCVQRAKKYPFKQVDEICITQGELDFIRSLDDIKREKIAFVLLAAAKYYDTIRETKYNTAYMRNNDICKLARVTIPAQDRDVFMQFAYDCNVLSRHVRAGSIEKKVLFVSQDNNDKVVLRLKENDFKDLAYTYLAYKSPRKFRKCVVCSCWMKKDSKDKQVCRACSEGISTKKDALKTKTCIDCGTSFYVDARNNSKERCDNCQEQYRKDYMRKLMQNKRRQT